MVSNSVRIPSDLLKQSARHRGHCVGCGQQRIDELVLGYTRTARESDQVAAVAALLLSSGLLLLAQSFDKNTPAP
jgi:hypothetical protein